MIGRQFFSFICLVVAYTTLIAGVTGGIVRHILGSELRLTTESQVYVKPGTGLLGVANTLKNAGAVPYAWHITLSANLFGYERRLQAGEYNLAPDMDVNDVLVAMKNGDTYKRRLVVPEGWSVKQVIALLKEAKGVVFEGEYLPTEGTLLPETYFYEYGDTAGEMIGRMQAAMQVELQSLWQMRASDVAVNSPEEALVLASIVEKETAVASERPLVAAVFTNRLNKRMRLQSDPTVIYGITEGLELGRPISRADLRELTPYNTYRINGLPPTAIASPGKDAIAAVLNPANVNYLYFVADGSGGHAFAETLKEHNRNVAAWRKLQQSK